MLIRPNYAYAFFAAALCVQAGGGSPALAQSAGTIDDEPKQINLTIAANDQGPDHKKAMQGEPFAEGSRVITAYASRTFFDDDHGRATAGHLGAHYYFDDQLSIGLDAVGGYVEPNWTDDGRPSPDEDGFVVALDLVMRWHFINEPDWSIYVDGGVGVQQANTDFPSDSHFNFRDQLGFGGTFRLSESVHLMGGVRYHHHSNASTSENNDGGDWALPYIGVMVPF
jgi:hypothetical protein